MYSVQVFVTEVANWRFLN